MRTCDTIQCTDFPCTDVRHECYRVPAIDLQPDAVRILLISEAVLHDKIRGGQFTYRSRRALPSYLQAGPSFFIEKSKRRMIAADIGTALSLSQRSTWSTTTR